MDRKIIISELRKQRRTFKEIAKILGISRQRVHQIYTDYNSTAEYIRNKILKRDEKQCLICGNNKNLEVHHINGVKKDNDENNLVTLCRKCHHRIEKADRKINGKKRDIIEREKIKKICPNCQKEYWIYKVEEKFGRKRFCSSKCFYDKITKYANKKEKYKAAIHRYNEKHKNDSRYKAQLKKWHKKSYLKLKEKGYFKNYWKGKYQKNPEKYKKLARDYYQKNKEKMRAYYRKRYKLVKSKKVAAVQKELKLKS